MTALKPCILERKILPKVWGGRALQTTLGLELPVDEAIGETWEVYDRPDGSSEIRDSRVTLRELMLQDSVGVLGRGVRPARGGYFPLILKYIDAADNLSVQVHPDDDKAPDDDGGKSEAWVVLGKSDGGRIVCGLKPGVTREQFAAVAHESEVEDLLRSIEPEVGDAIFVPAGTVHSIGPGVVVFEVQQNSDVTYRLYDWGRPRETHVEAALDCLRVDSNPGVETGDGEWLFRNPFFTTRRMTILSPANLGTEGTFKTVSVIEGQATLGWHSGGQEAPLLLRCGDTALVPAATEVTFISPIGKLTVLVCGPGETD
jgi:mannose-6-phosphate isomerase